MKTNTSASSEATRKKKGTATALTAAAPAPEASSDKATVIRQRKQSIRKDRDDKRIDGRTEVPASKQLSVAEEARLKKHESTIQKGLETFWAVGLAFAEIRNHKLFQPKYKTWNEYLKIRWDWTKQRASQLIIAAEARTILAKHVDEANLPTSERAMRALLAAPEAKRARIVKLAAKKGSPTTTTIIDARVEVLGPVSSSKKEKKEAIITIVRALEAFKTTTRYLAKCVVADLTKGQKTQLVKAHAKLATRFTKLGLTA